MHADGSYKKISQTYDAIVLADNEPAYPGRITAGAGIIISPTRKHYMKLFGVPHETTSDRSCTTNITK